MGSQHIGSPLNGLVGAGVGSNLLFLVLYFHHDGRVGVGGGGVGVEVGWGGPRYHRSVWWVVGGGVQWMGPSICGYVGGWVWGWWCGGGLW